MNTKNILAEKTAVLNLFQFCDIPKEYLKPQILNGSTFDYSSKVNNEYSLPDDILKKYEHGLFWECKKQFKNSEPNEVELYYIEHSRVLFLSPKGNLIRLCKDKNKYYFTLDYSHYNKVQHISYYQREEAIKNSGIVEPNYIGVFSDKKINDWFVYLDLLAEINEQIVLNANDKNKQIETEIQNFINSVKCSVSKWHDKTEVKTALFTVRFTHDKKSQYLSKEIVFNGSLTDVISLSK